MTEFRERQENNAIFMPEITVSLVIEGKNKPEDCVPCQLYLQEVTAYDILLKTYQQMGWIILIDREGS